MGFKLLKEKKSVQIIWITAEERDLENVKQRKVDLDIDYLYFSVKDKLKKLQTICDNLNIDIEQEVVYIGDDITDIPILKKVKYAFCPANSVYDVHHLTNTYSLSRKGGKGCVREAIDKLERDGRFKTSFNNR